MKKIPILLACLGFTLSGLNGALLAVEEDTSSNSGRPTSAPGTSESGGAASESADPSSVSDHTETTAGEASNPLGGSVIRSDKTRDPKIAPSTEGPLSLATPPPEETGSSGFFLDRLTERLKQVLGK